MPISLSLAKTSSYDVVNKLIVEGLYVVFSILRYFRKQFLKIKTMRGKKEFSWSKMVIIRVEGTSQKKG